ncbi:MAG: MFS transporter [Steroidobacteraceae bacterium]
MNLRLIILAICQGLFLTNNVTLAAINGLVGLSLAPVPWLATLPLMAYVSGAALCTRLVARHQLRWGRRRAFQAGLLVAIATSGLACFAVATGRFWLLVAATAIAGYYSANASLYRFAAIELVRPAFHSRAIAWVLAGGIIGAVAGPNLARLTKDLAGIPFVGAYAALAGVGLLGLLLVSCIEFPQLEQPTPGQPGRSAWQLAQQPAFLVAVVIAALSYGVMNLLMAATPIAMTQCGHRFAATAMVLEWHVLGMFVPSFLTGSLIRRFGIRSVMAAGAGCYALCIAIALAGVSLMHFTAALLLLGVGWNFLYVGGTTLLTTSYQPHEKTRAQATMDLCVFSTMAVTSLSSGALVSTGGWHTLNLVSIPLLLIIVLAIGSVPRARRSNFP